jgi:hypothetical protein
VGGGFTQPHLFRVCHATNTSIVVLSRVLLQAKSPSVDPSELRAVLEAQEAATAGMTRNRSEATGVRSNLRIGAHKLYGFEGAWLTQGLGVFHL